MRAVATGIIMMLLALIPVASHAQSKPAAPFDQLFLRNEATGSAYELAIAQLAQTRATREDVRSYASTLVNDHEAYNGALRDLAKQKSVALPPGLTAKSQAKLADLSKLNGAAFDRAFIREAKRINDDDVRDFRREASRTTDPEIRSFVTKFLAVDEQHARGAAALQGTNVAAAPGSRMPVIKPPVSGANMPVIAPPASGASMPVIPPPSSDAK